MNVGLGTLGGPHAGAAHVGFVGKDEGGGNRRDGGRRVRGGGAWEIARENGERRIRALTSRRGGFPVFYERIKGALGEAFPKKNTYVVLFVFGSWIFRRDSRRDGNGRRNGDHSPARTRRGRRAKNSAMRKPFFLLADERVGVKNARGKRVVANARNFMDGVARPAFFRARRNACHRVAILRFTQGVRRFFDRTCLFYYAEK